MIQDTHPLAGVEPGQIALHESCHAIAALEMGLPVSWVDINGPQVAEWSFMAATFIPKRVEFPDDAEAVAVSLAAPSRWPSGHEGLDYYAGLELHAALEIAGSNGIDYLTVLDRVALIVREREESIRDLSHRLLNEGGKVSFPG